MFLTDLGRIWSHFSQFNSTHLAALTPEHEDANMGWYNRFARHPFYGSLGLNSGVMLMNLTRMREFHFVDKIYPLYDTYKYNITWGDQCLLNILFHFHPGIFNVKDLFIFLVIKIMNFSQKTAYLSTIVRGITDPIIACTDRTVSRARTRALRFFTAVVECFTTTKSRLSSSSTRCSKV